MRYASVCSGVEAASLAWMPLGWEAMWFSEIEPFPCAVLKERFPDVPNLGDMTKIKGEKYYGTVDLLVGGTPCQGFSVAGKRGGIDDPRSALCLAYCRLLETMRPRWFVWENVPGVFSTNQGDDFRAFLGKIDEIGYSVAWRVLDAQYVRVDGFPRAVPQRRRRVFVVGHLGGDWRYPASVLFEPGCLPGDTPPRRVKGEGVATGAKGSIGETGAGVARSFAQSTRTTGSGVFWNGNDYAETLKANCDCDRMPDKGRLNCVIDIRTATGQENAETATDCCVNLTCNHEAPIVCAGFSGGQGEKAGGIGYQDEVAPTIRSSESGSNQVPDILCQYGDVAGALTARHDSSPCVDRGATIVYENHAQDSRVKPCGECSPQINARAGTGGGNLPLVQECFPINSMIIGKNVKVGDRQTTGIGNAGDPLPTISSAHHHAVAVAENIIGRKENIGANGTGAQVELAYTQNATGVMGVSVNTTVRQLLPIECERLMGFHDNWTRIPWRGKPAEDCPDSPRYKACGNSMCVNVMRWIGMRIENVERRMKGSYEC